jgi:3-oxoacyl-(acyl-carrier-protein) synthase
LNQDNLNTFVLGEGAAMFALERMTTSEIKALNIDSIITVEAVGMGFERSPSRTGISPEGTHFQSAICVALAQAHLAPSEIDSVVLHAPGTRAGDAAEVKAIEKTFGSLKPVFLSNKGQIGHTLGASGALSAHLAIELLQNPLLGNPFLLSKQEDYLRKLQNILVNAAGFGGNAASLLLTTRTI